MITIALYGNLRKYGRRFDLHVGTAAEALRLLMVQLEGFRQDLERGSFQVRFKKSDLSEENLKEGLHEQTEGVLHIVPRVQGAGKNIGAIVNIVIGIVLVIASWPSGGAAGWSYMAAAGVLGGAAMVLGGVSQLLTKAPSLDNLQDGADASKNSNFSNLQNTIGQGTVVPVAYGRVRIGSKVISQGLETRGTLLKQNKEIKVTGAGRVGRVNNDFIEEVGGEQVPSTPAIAAADLIIKKIYVPGVASVAPNGVPYNTDFNNDSVRARNYIAKIKEV